MAILNSLQDLNGAGPAMLDKLKQLGISKPIDLLFHLPRSYQDRTKLTPMNQLRVGQFVMLEGVILDVKVVRLRQSMLIVRIADETSIITCRFFHFRQQQINQMQVGDWMRCYGEIRYGREGFEITHPEYRVRSEQAELETALPLSDTLMPVYPITDGLSQKRIQSFIEQTFAHFDQFELTELLPQTICTRYDYPSLFDALKLIHYPPADIDWQVLFNGSHPAQQRLIFEELLAHRLSLLQKRQQAQQVPAFALRRDPPVKPEDDMLCVKLRQNLPFAFTQAQERVITEISTDMEKPIAMMRLLQGDVGSGKTIVALMAILKAIEAGYQAAIMAPTEILAEQHFNHFKAYLDQLNINTVWLASKLKTSIKKEAYAQIQSGQAQVIVGTHALFQDGVNYHRLALVVIDEQHRFGVQQRQALQHKGKQAGHLPHQLIMTATPIPRTLAMTAYADLSLSIIDELPPGRTPIETKLVNNQRRDEVIAKIQTQCESGTQVYWVCPLIEESETLNCENAQATYEKLQQALPHLKIGLVHGRLKPDAKSAVMQDFLANQMQVLVATTVIEVGVNVPNASLMIIENAERLGLSQLHQLRGRVGRGHKQSYCLLMYQTPLSERARARLQTIKDYTDGFKIAEVDLQLRGPGEIIGTKQTGEVDFKLADLLRDQKLLPTVQQAADEIIEHHPAQIAPLITRWLGNKQQYALV